ncbi:MAG TPA: hypothetical protein VF068_12825 [Rubrobacter sp.]
MPLSLAAGQNHLLDGLESRDQAFLGPLLDEISARSSIRSMRAGAFLSRSSVVFSSSSPLAVGLIDWLGDVPLDPEPIPLMFPRLVSVRP